jgi:DNA-binding NarL/FixJ family response regulator
MAKTRILLADDHPLFLDGLVSLLKRETDFEVVATASNGKEAVDAATQHSPDVCILDVNMPVMDGIETVKQIRLKKMDAKIIMLTTFNDLEFIKALVQQNISGYVLKNSTGDELVSAIRKVVEGKTWFSPEVQQLLTEDFVRGDKKDSNQVTLTPREIDIVRLLSKELTNEKIAEQLFISYRTVETHRKNIMQKTGAKNLAGLINFAHSNGLLK